MKGMIKKRKHNLAGMVFKRLTVLSPVAGGKWLCRCECGNDKIVRSDSLIAGDTVSCGCFRVSGVFNIGKGRFKGFGSTLTGSSWHSMIGRCFNPKNYGYRNYGGRGIVPCEFLRASPINLAMVIGERTAKDQTLDRIDSNLGYLCGQCAECLKMGYAKNIRWATMKQQQRNRRYHLYAEKDGQTKLLVEWAEETGLTYNTLIQRYEKGHRGEMLFRQHQAWTK